METNFSLINSGEFGLKDSYRAEDILFLTKLTEHLISVDTEEIFDKLTLLLSRYIEVEKLKIYHFNLNKKTFKLKISVGCNDNLQSGFSLDSKPLLAHAIFHSQAVRSPEDPFTLHMFLKVNCIPIAFISLKVATSERISTETIKLFEALVNFAGFTLERNNPVAGLHSYHPERRIMERNEFEKRVDIERRRKKLFGSEHCILKYRLSNKDFDFFRNKILSSITETDYIGYDYSEESLLLLFPCVSHDLAPYLKDYMSKYHKLYNISIIK